MPRRRHRRPRTINPQAQQHRTLLRTLGAVLATIGAVFTVVGLTSFFGSMGTFEPPDKFWCAFVGLPLLGIGFAMLKAGFLGTVVRYTAGEIAPVASDTAHYLADSTRDAVRSVAGALKAGLTDAESPAATACPVCGGANDEDARFCDQCGTELAAQPVCRQCHAPHDPGARFCDQCGAPLTG